MLALGTRGIFLLLFPRLHASRTAELIADEALLGFLDDHQAYCAREVFVHALTCCALHHELLFANLVLLLGKDFILEIAQKCLLWSEQLG